MSFLRCLEDTQFPFSAVCTEIVRELKMRRWSVSEFSVTFNPGSSCATDQKEVFSVQSDYVRLIFFRFHDLGGVSRIAIPGQEIGVFSDETGPWYSRYTGDDWENDRQKFMDAQKTRCDEEGFFVSYQGGCDCSQGILGHHHQGIRSPLLIPIDDGLREDESNFLYTVKVMEEFRSYLEQEVLARIVKYPVIKSERSAYH